MSASPIDGGVVLITGASSGIGERIAHHVVFRARVIVLVARRKERLEALAEELHHKRPGVEIDVRVCDLTDSAKALDLIRGVESSHGSVDVLVNNAGLGDIGLFEKADVDKTLRMIQLNVVGLTALTRAALPGMVDRGKGGVLMISSGFGLTPMPGFAAYVGTKHYVTGFTESLRGELSGTGVRITQVCPGPVQTEFEANAESPLDMPAPEFMMISADHCAQVAVRSFDEDMPLSVPGGLATVMMALARLTPRFVLRGVHALTGRQLRAQLTSSDS
jgi:short-subunit dehydrogenase